MCKRQPYTCKQEITIIIIIIHGISKETCRLEGNLKNPQTGNIEHFPTVNQEHLGENFPAKYTTPNVPPRNFTWSDFYISLMNSNALTTPTFYIGYHRLLVARINCSSHPSPLFFVFTWVKPRRPPAQCELFDRACDPIHLGALESNDPSHERKLLNCLDCQGTNHLLVNVQSLLNFPQWFGPTNHK